MWLPLPGDLLIVYFGYRVAHSPHPLLGAIPVLLCVTMAVLAGSSLLYVLVRRFRRLARRIAPVIHLKEERLARMEGWIQRRGPLVIVPGRLIPGLRIPTTIVAGLFDISYLVFVPAVALAAFLWALIYFLIGAAGGVIIDALRDSVQSETSEWLLPLLLALGLLAAFVYLWRRMRSSSGSH